MATRKPEVHDLDAAVSKVAPIVGVSRGTDTIRIDYAPEATAAQKRAAQAVVDGWDWNQEIEAEPTLEKRVANLESMVAKLQADIEALKK